MTLTIATVIIFITMSVNTPTQSRQIITISLPPFMLQKLSRISKKERKTRSQVVRDLIDKYETESMWEEIYKWGSDAAAKFNIKSEKDVLKILND